MPDPVSPEPASGDDPDNTKLSRAHGGALPVLVAPLNWGLGHATRCVPVIRALERMGAAVHLASDGAALHLLKAEFPHLPAHTLPSYHIRYDTSNMVRNIARQAPRILYAVRAERMATDKLVQKYGIRGILSDNRYGCFNRRAHSVMLSHQLNLRVPDRLLEWCANRLLRKALAKFDAVWVPDVESSEGNLSGDLSHPGLGRETVYIGPLSRLRASDRAMEYDAAVVLSGPEPQRTLLEQILLEQALALPERRFIFIQGKTASKQHYYAADHVEVVSYFTSEELNEALAASAAVVCRSGYSSIMDLAAIGRRALLIPTPGQTEQEYLADYLAAQRVFAVQKQGEVDLEKGLNRLATTTGFRAGQFDSAGFEGRLGMWVRVI
jgi:UDP:flavonoid glycosyltransferase YjiC (YdhE family)